MRAAPASVETLLSICIPTYCRATNLRSLFGTLLPIKQRFGREIEICVSNNGSPDETRAVIEEFAGALDLRVVHQQSNIGGTLNIIEVSQLVRGRWGMFLGDDDELVADVLSELLDILRAGSTASWILIDAQDAAARTLYLGHFRAGMHSRSQFRFGLRTMGMNSFGFMGVHVFPRSAVVTFRALDLENARPWPHMACMLRETSAPAAQILVVRRALTVQAVDAKLFWAAGDLARIRLDMIRVLMRAYQQGRGSFVFYHALMLRSLYSRVGINSLICWKLYEPGDFRQRGPRTYLTTYSWLGVIAPLALPHALLMALVSLVPAKVYAKLFRWVGLGRFLDRYEKEKRELGAFDGIKRGI